MAKWSAADDPTIYIIRATESSPNTNANKGLPLTTDSQIISSECAEGALVEISQSLHRHINTSHTNKRCICICIVSFALHSGGDDRFGCERCSVMKKQQR